MLAPLVAALAAFVVFAMMVNVVEVFLVRDTLDASATWYGLLGATWAAGVVAGAILAGRLASEHARVVGSCAAAGTMSLVFLAFAAAPSVLLLVPVSLVGGAANGVLNVAASAVVMTRTPDTIRGRVAAALGAIVSAGSVASLVAGGALAAALSPRQVFALSGALALLAVALLVPRAMRASRRVATGAQRVAAAAVRSS